MDKNPEALSHTHTFLLVGEAGVAVRSLQQSPQGHGLTGTHVTVP